MENESIRTKVEKDRWMEAQRWEEKFWVNAEKARARYGKNYIWRVLSKLGLKPMDRGDDSNLWWKKQLDEYSFLPSKLDNAIELGCGPYTNMRLILPKCQPQHLILSDPLIKTYVTFPLGFVARAYRDAFCMLDDHPIEDGPFASDFFDLVVMTNVLDHVRDADECMREAVRITKKGGYLIIGQELSNATDIAKIDPHGEGHIGHPIKVNHEWMDGHLTAFKPVIKKILSREEGRGPEHHYGTYVFAGLKST